MDVLCPAHLHVLSEHFAADCRNIRKNQRHGGVATLDMLAGQTVDDLSRPRTHDRSDTGNRNSDRSIAPQHKLTNPATPENIVDCQRRSKMSAITFSLP